MRKLTQAQLTKQADRKAKRLAMIKQLNENETAVVTIAGYESVLGHHYSYRNQAFLALQQVPFGKVAGFAQWIKLGRAVKKGEHGADIMIPMTKKHKAVDGKTTPTEDDDTFFSWASVFHISQTEALTQRA